MFRKLFELKNYLSLKTIWVEKSYDSKLYELKNYMSWKIKSVEILYESKLYDF